MEQKQIGVKFTNPPKIYYYDPNGLELAKGDFVVVETARGLELGQVATNASNHSKNEELKIIVRKATENDIQQTAENKKKIPEYIKRTKAIVKKLNLDMKIVAAELTLDNSKIVISFTAENRVDFRELVRVLASEFRMKIELRQIGSRDEVQMMGSVGICGKTCCCNKNTGDFEHVSIKMAKVQGLSLNPNNIAGACGKLLCCLGYENKEYVEVLELMPKINSDVKTPKGTGRVLYNNILKKTVQVRIDDDVFEFPLEEIKIEVYNNKK